MFESFDVDCGDDSVDIYEGNKLMTELCGTNPPAIFSSQPALLVKIITDSITEGSTSPGNNKVDAFHMHSISIST